MHWRDAEILARVGAARGPATAAAIISITPAQAEREMRQRGIVHGTLSAAARAVILAEFIRSPVQRAARRLGMSPEAVVAVADEAGLIDTDVKVWTDARINQLRELLGTMTHKALAVALGRSVDAVVSAVRKFGLAQRPRGRMWTAADDAYVRNSFGSRPASEIGAAIGRSGPAVRARAQKLGLVEKRR